MKNFFGLIILLILIVGCVPSQIEPSSTPSYLPPTSTTTSTSTAIPTQPSTVTPSPTLALPVVYQTPIPISNEQITSKNIKNLREIAHYYGSTIFTVALTTDQNLLFVRDPVGIDIYEYPTSKHLNHIALFGSTLFSYGSSALDLQISVDGEWVLADWRWLIHHPLEKDPELRDLVSEFALEEISSRQIRLSPDGSKIVITDGGCQSCLGVFQIISLVDNRVLYSWDDGSYKQLHGHNPIFSADGSLIVTRVDTQIVLWRVSDQIPVARIKNIQGVSNLVLSSDSSLIAIGQVNTVQIWDVDKGQRIQTISGLCGELYNSPQPVFLDAKRIVVLECPRDGEGKVSVWSVAEARSIFENTFGPIAISRIVYKEDDDQATLLENPRIVGPWASTRGNLQFLKNGILTFGDGRCSINSNSLVRCSGDIILGTDEQFYNYTIQDERIEFRLDTIKNGDAIYSLHWKSGWVVNALDPINGLLFYTLPTGPNSSSSNIIDLESGQSRGEWQNTFIERAIFSGNKEYVALCRKAHSFGISTMSNIDKLTIIDLSKKEVIQQQIFTCYVSIALTKDGSRLASVYAYVDGQNHIQHKLLIMNTAPPAEKKIIDIGCNKIKSLTFSTDESMLAVACNDGTIRFLDPYTTSEILHLTDIDPDISGLAFSKDGTMLAMVSERRYISVWAVPPFHYIALSPSPQYAWEFTSGGDTEGWEAWNQLAPLLATKGNLVTKSTGTDPHMGSPMIMADAAALSKIEIRMKVSTGSRAQLFFITNFDSKYDEAKSLHFSVVGDNQFHIYNLDMTSVKGWNGTIYQLRFDPVIRPATIEIDYIRLTGPDK